MLSPEFPTFSSESYLRFDYKKFCKSLSIKFGFKLYSDCRNFKNDKIEIEKIEIQSAPGLLTDINGYFYQFELDTVSFNIYQTNCKQTNNNGSFSSREKPFRIHVTVTPEYLRSQKKPKFLRGFTSLFKIGTRE